LETRVFSIQAISNGLPLAAFVSQSIGQQKWQSQQTHARFRVAARRSRAIRDAFCECRGFGFCLGLQDHGGFTSGARSSLACGVFGAPTEIGRGDRFERSFRGNAGGHGGRSWFARWIAWLLWYGWYVFWCGVRRCLSSRGGR